MNTTTIKSKPVYFPTEIWNEIKSYMPKPEPPLVRCMNVSTEWCKRVLPELSKKAVAKQLREWSSETDPNRKYTPYFNEMTDPSSNRYKRMRREELCVLLARQIHYKIRNALGEWGVLYNYNEFDYMGWNPKEDIAPEVLIAYRETYKMMRRHIKLALQGETRFV